LPDQWQIQLFLHHFKRAWLPECIVVGREKNNQALADLGMTPYQRRDLVMALTVENYSEGPFDDHQDPDQQVWVFGAEAGDRQVYIKSALKEVSGVFRARCLSFHAAEQGLVYPFGRPVEGGCADVGS
jgi:hypothetical protein